MISTEVFSLCLTQQGWLQSKQLLDAPMMVSQVSQMSGRTKVIGGRIDFIYVTQIKIQSYPEEIPIDGLNIK